MENSRYALDGSRESFEYIRRNAKVFVDKTALMFELIKYTRNGFILRPPYFGKTLLHSMLTAYFQGKKEHFKGLAIEKLETEWKRREVFYFDFTRGQFDQFGALDAYISAHLTVWEHLYDCVPTYTRGHSFRLHDLFRRAKEITGLEPVILIDGYDQPMLDALADRKVLEENRHTMIAFLTSFEGNAHGTDFFLVTGLTKFGLWDPYQGGFQSVHDVTTYDKYSTLFGITDEELHGQLGEEVRELAEARMITEEECYARLRQEYGGYWFGTHEKVEVYDPYHLLLALKNKSFEPKIEEKDVPKRIRDIVNLRKYVFCQCYLRREDQYTKFDTDTMYTSNEMLLLHYGYLQRGKKLGKDRNWRELYELQFPNLEVERRFFNQLTNLCMPYALRSDIERGTATFDSLMRGRVKDFILELNKYFRQENGEDDSESSRWKWYWGPEEEDKRTQEHKEADKQKAKQKARARFLTYAYNSLVCWMWHTHTKGQVLEDWCYGRMTTFLIELQNASYAITFYESEKAFEKSGVSYPGGEEKDYKEVAVLLAPEGRLVAKWKDEGGPVVEVGEEEEPKRESYFGAWE